MAWTLPNSSDTAIKNYLQLRHNVLACRPPSSFPAPKVL
jgi:hypothetical protein